MSKQETIKIRCNHCGKEIEVNAWSSVNVQLNPELKDKILDDSLFEFECPECKKKTRNAYPLIYHDMDKKKMILFNKAAEIVNIIELGTQMENKNPTGISYWGTRTWLGLCTDIIALDLGLDYRVLQFSLLQNVAQLIDYFYEKSPDEAGKYNIDDAGFIKVNGEYRLVFIVDGQKLDIKFDEERILKQYQFTLDSGFVEPEDTVKQYFLDFDGVLDIMEYIKKPVLNRIGKGNTYCIFDDTVFGGDSMIARIPHYIKENVNVGDYAVFDYKKQFYYGKIKKIFIADELELPIHNLPLYGRKHDSYELKTSRDSNYDLDCTDKMQVIEENLEKGKSITTEVDDLEFILGYKTSTDFSEDVLLDMVDRFKNGEEVIFSGDHVSNDPDYETIDGKDYLCLYSSKDEMKGEDLSRAIFKFRDLARMMATNSGYDGFIINKNSNRIILNHNNVCEYLYERIMADNEKMKRLLNSLTDDEKHEVAHESLPLIWRVYFDPTFNLQEEEKKYGDVVGKKLDVGYGEIINIVLANYFDKDMDEEINLDIAGYDCTIKLEEK